MNDQLKRIRQNEEITRTTESRRQQTQRDERRDAAGRRQYWKQIEAYTAAAKNLDPVSVYHLVNAVDYRRTAEWTGRTEEELHVAWAEGRKLTHRTQGDCFSMNAAKLAAVAAIVGEDIARASCIDYDWSNADEHQAWLDSAEAEEIAAWVRDTAAFAKAAQEE